MVLYCDSSRVHAGEYLFGGIAKYYYFYCREIQTSLMLAKERGQDGDALLTRQQ